MFKSIFLLCPLSEKARIWVARNLNIESWQVVGGLGVSIGHRFVADIIEAMKRAGLKRNKDYMIK